MSKKNCAIVKISIFGLLAVLLVFLLIVLLNGGIKGKFSFFKSKDYKLVYSKEFDKNSFNDFYFNLMSADLDIVYSDSDKIKLEVYDTVEKNVSVNENDGVLSVNFIKSKNFCFGFCFIDKSARLSLPEDFKGRVDIKSSSGDVYMDEFGNIDGVIKSTSGDVEVRKINSLNVKTTSGDITVMSANSANAVTTSGDMTLYNISNLKFESTSGDVEVNKANIVEGVTTSGEFDANNINGSVKFNSTSGDVDLDYITLEQNSSISTVSGEVDVNLLNSVYVDASSVSGDKDIINSDRNSKVILKVSTTSGDIEVR